MLELWLYDTLLIFAQIGIN